MEYFCILKYFLYGWVPDLTGRPNCSCCHGYQIQEFKTEHTAGLVVGQWRGKDKSSFDNDSLIISDSLQVSCRFPDLKNCALLVYYMFSSLVPSALSP